MDQIVEDAVSTKNLIRKFIGTLTHDGYEKPLDEPLGYVVELRPESIWIGIQDLTGRFGNDEDGWSFRIMVEYVSDKTTARVEGMRSGWRAWVWADGNNGEPEVFYLTPVSEQESETA